jgi:hypothetical protein
MTNDLPEKNPPKFSRKNLVAPRVFERRQEAAIQAAARKRKNIITLAVVLPLLALLGFGIYYKSQSAARTGAMQQETQAMVEEQYPGIGKKPEQNSLDSSVPVIDQYLRNNLNDYESAEFLGWSRATPTKIEGQNVWSVKLRLRAKNAFGGKIVKDVEFFILNDSIISVTGLNG